MAVSGDRMAGYELAHEDFDVAQDPALVEPGDFTEEGGQAAMQALLERAPDIDAVFAASDLMAAGALRELDRLTARCRRTWPWSGSTTPRSHGTPSRS